MLRLVRLEALRIELQYSGLLDSALPESTEADGRLRSSELVNGARREPSRHPAGEFIFVLIQEFEFGDNFSF